MSNNTASNGTTIGSNSEGKVVPCETDILCARGGAALHHPGTQVYRSLVNKNKVAYVTCADKDKIRISRSIVLTLQEQGRRFLAKAKDGTWYILEDKKAVEKTSQALREGQPELKQKLYQSPSLGDDNNETKLNTTEAQLDLTSTSASPALLKVSPKRSKNAAPYPAVVVAPEIYAPAPTSTPGIIKQPKEQNGNATSNYTQDLQGNDLPVASFGIGFSEFLSPQAMESINSIPLNEIGDTKKRVVTEFASSSAAYSAMPPPTSIPYQQLNGENSSLHQYYHLHSQPPYTIPQSQQHFPPNHSFDHYSEANPHHRDIQFMGHYGRESENVTCQQSFESSTNYGHFQQQHLQSQIPWELQDPSQFHNPNTSMLSVKSADFDERNNKSNKDEVKTGSMKSFMSIESVNEEFSCMSLNFDKSILDNDTMKSDRVLQPDASNNNGVLIQKPHNKLNELRPQISHVNVTNESTMSCVSINTFNTSVISMQSITPTSMSSICNPTTENSLKITFDSLNRNKDLNNTESARSVSSQRDNTGHLRQTFAEMKKRNRRPQQQTHTVDENEVHEFIGQTLNQQNDRPGFMKDNSANTIGSIGNTTVGTWEGSSEILSRATIHENEIFDTESTKITVTKHPKQIHDEHTLKGEFSNLFDSAIGNDSFGTFASFLSGANTSALLVESTKNNQDNTDSFIPFSNISQQENQSHERGHGIIEIYDDDTPDRGLVRSLATRTFQAS